MRRRNWLFFAQLNLVVVLMFMSASRSAFAQGEAAPTKNSYLLFPIRTQLQREYTFSKVQRFLLVVNCDEMTDDAGRIDSRRLNFNDRDFDAVNTIRFVKDSIGYDLFATKGPTDSAARLVALSIIGWTHVSGFEGATAIGTISGDGQWKIATKMLGDKRGLIREDQDEGGVGDETVRVYPVRTILSRYSEGEDTDCIISFPQTLENDLPEELDEKTVAKVKSLVTSLKLKSVTRVKIAFFEKIGHDPKGYREFTANASRQIADALGIKHYAVCHRYQAEPSSH